MTAIYLGYARQPLFPTVTQMRILLLSLGTRGDIQPFLALGKGLLRRGHEVTVCSSGSFGPWIEGHGLRFAPLNNDIIDLVKSDAGRRAMQKQGGLLGLPRRLLESSRNFKAIFRRTLAEQWQAAQGTQAIIYHPNAVGGYHIAEALGIPGIMADPLPTWVPTGAFPHIVTPDPRLGRFYNRLTHRVIGLVPRLLFGNVVARWRRETLGLPDRPLLAQDLIRANGQPVPVLLCFSRHVIPPPSDWPPTVRVSGYCFLDEASHWEPPPDLVQFLGGGPPPVFVGFGSMAGPDPSKSGEIVLRALALSGERGLIVTGWGGLTIQNPPANVHVCEFVPYDWLLPQVAVVTHHGGAGTTAAAMRAGKPMIVCPFVADQPFWGRRVAALGIGPRPIHQKNLTAERLAQAIREAVSDMQMRCRAVELGAKIRSEDGLANALGFITDHFETRSGK
jgi:sterol 3beta-glucosyltransferase